MIKSITKHNQNDHENPPIKFLNLNKSIPINPHAIKLSKNFTKNPGQSSSETDKKKAEKHRTA
jgi:hypothetical protein